ncbi:bifunctional 4-hydroxy-2-oxoglutarate aldolase/2-dehydro-3-deoxy-phosphogluconate aldolase [Nonomuraea gerenzanensis]|uniref:4-hydroxy-2-oxoglutarate aldolase @ 2-dehydro-3-deoxyphosphogluconate aldolase n=1 Tax=Nonomuraea gerenzanensis TaxID=93944 RepID=A0A1M4EC01_9ACTN|nr:bifunctional 4-hydroxy-2-oxoglutarate aldolase/2-dehydro-3-deoxy-phosphogluconate aldolase [Nonomuraea gerenzanensis]UBU18397.1 bifunctional 4-hydroxy-2-oxoglutarate aldolase/2-dehydro-3-deoxy-phosphogluconate aldolase [Nonomuraea gerenzanensis]SBO96228.1 4-hydroxy-2-oxoglutarate aldolase @ 2-dehydro-3-deoxyphosphogluconate aldolase [Nonomuraea gerenzanensis]
MAEHRWALTARLVERRVIGIVRAPSPAAAVEAGTRLTAAGVTAVEISLATPDALSAVTALRTAAPPEALVGAGTVLDAAQAMLAIQAGARFLVCPSLSREVIRTAHRHGVPVAAGAATPTEIVTALEEGADLVKLFPASQTSPQVLRDVLQALPHAPLVPTGGVTIRTAPDWVAAGAVAVGMGGELTRAAPADVRTFLSALTS